MDTKDFPELQESSDLELLRTRKELLELKAKAERYEQILKENDLLDSVPASSDTEILCVKQLSKYREVVDKGIPLSLEDVKIVDILHKNLLLARGKAVPAEDGRTKKKKEEKVDVAKLLQLAGSKEE